MIRVAAVRNPFQPFTRETAIYEEPMTVTQALERHPMPDYLPFVCVIEGQFILRSDDWDTWMIPQDAVCCFVACAGATGGQGQKNPMASILLLVVAAAVSYGAAAVAGGAATATTAATGLTASIGGPGAGLAASFGAHLIVGVGAGAILAGASYLINLALPPSYPKQPDAPDPVYSITSRSNQARLGYPQEVGFGEMQFYPSLISAPFSENSDSFAQGSFDDQNVGEQTNFQIFMEGWGYYDNLSIDLLNQSLDAFPEAVIEKFEPGELITSFPSGVLTVNAVSNIELPFPLSNHTASGLAAVETITDGSDTADELQKVTLENWDSSSQIKFRFMGQETPYLSITLSATDLEAQLRALSTIGSRNVICKDGPLGTRAVSIYFVNALSKTPLPEIELVRDRLVALTDTFPNWGTIDVYQEDTVSAAGTDGTRAYLEFPGSIAVDDALIGRLLQWGRAGDRAFFTDNSSSWKFHSTPGPVVPPAVTIVHNIYDSGSDRTRIYWEVPADPTTLRDVNGIALLPEIAGALSYTTYFQIYTLKNYKTYSINADTSSGLINQIAFDISIPDPRFMMIGKATPSRSGIPLGWRAEYQRLLDDGSGAPYDGTWVPLVTDPKYYNDLSANFFNHAANVILAGESDSATRFTVKADVPQGRYQFRLANVSFFNAILPDWYGGLRNFSTPVHAGLVPPGIPPDRSAVLALDGPRFSDLEDNKKASGKSFWTGLKGYEIKQTQRYPGRTVVTARLTATEGLNSSTIHQFAITAIRKLQDYHGPINNKEALALPADSLTTEVFAGIATTAPTSGASVPNSLKTSQIIFGGIGLKFNKKDWVRLSGFGDSNDGEYLIIATTDNTLTVRGILTDNQSNISHIAGSRRVYCNVPTIVSGVTISDEHTLSKTGIGLITDFAKGNTITLRGFATESNFRRCTIADSTNDTLIVEETLVPEGPGEVHSRPPYGLNGQLLDGARAVMSGAEDLGGITAANLNTVEHDNVGVAIQTDGAARLTSTGIGSHDEAVVGAMVTLMGFTNKRNQETLVITAVSADYLAVATPPSSDDAPVPVLSSLVTETAASGKKVAFGARKFVMTGDTQVYFFASSGATSAASGGGSSVSIRFPNIWTELQPSRRISSAAYDLSTDPDFGGGVDGNKRINLLGLRRREATWDSRDRYEDDGITWKLKPIKDTYNIRLTERRLLLDVLNSMARCGRARPVFPSGVMDFVRDEPRPVADDMFTMRNTTTGSIEYTSTFPTDDTADHVLVQYFDREIWDFNEVVATLTPYSVAQRLVVRGAQDSDSVQITYRGKTTAPFGAHSSHTVVQSALEALPNVSPGTLTCSGHTTDGDGMRILYSDALEGTNVPLMTVAVVTGGGTVHADIEYEVNPAWPGTAPARLQLEGVTDNKQAWREGMYELGSLMERRIAAVFGTDVEGYLPSFLSRVDIVDNVLSVGQQGLVVDYKAHDTYAAVFCSEPLKWEAGTSYVMQFRDAKGAPIPGGLWAVTEGDSPNEARIDTTASAPDTDEIGLHTEHQFLREATFFSFGPINKHSTPLLITGIRPTSQEAVTFDAYLYKEKGVYDLDGDLDYISPSEQEVLDTRKIGSVTGLQATLLDDNGKAKIQAQWAGTPWAKYYLVEMTLDPEGVWNKVTRTTDTSAKFILPPLSPQYSTVVSGYTCGLIITPTYTVIARNPSTQTTPWTAGQFDGMYIRFTSGTYKDLAFLIHRTFSDGIFLFDALDPAPIRLVDTFDILERIDPVIWVGVRGYNGVYGPRTKISVDLKNAGLIITPPNSIGGTPAPPPNGDTGGYRVDEYGNVFINGKFFDHDHVTRFFYAGTECSYDSSDPTKAYLPTAPRYVDGRPSMMLFTQDSKLKWVASGPGANEFSLSGTVITLGFNRESAERLRFIMVAGADDSGALEKILVGVPCSFTPGESTALLPDKPARDGEILLFLNGDEVLIPTDSMTPGPGQFYLSPGAGVRSVTIATTLSADDELLCLMLAQEQTMEADRFHCVPFGSSVLPYVPLFPAHVAIVQGGSMRWNSDGAGNFGIDATVTPKTTIIWEDPQPAASETKYAILMRAKA